MPRMPSCSWASGVKPRRATGVVGRVGRLGASRALSVSSRDFHSLTWLQYEWTQQGRFAKASEALRLVDEASKATWAAAPARQSGGHHYGDSEIGRVAVDAAALRNDRGFDARALRHRERALGEMKGQGSFDNVDELFALGMSAYKLGDRGRLTAAVGEFEKMSTGPIRLLREQASVMLHELGALLLLARRPEGRSVRGDGSGRGGAGDGSRSRSGGRIRSRAPMSCMARCCWPRAAPKEAIAWFERALTRTPNRSRAVLGLARAAAKSGDAAKSRGVSSSA